MLFIAMLFMAIPMGAILMRAIEDAIDIIIRAGAAIGQHEAMLIICSLLSRPVPDRACVPLFIRLDAERIRVM
ncbi:MAG: hypothetical protein ABL967_10495 [Bryobacteraceae bacterium]